MLNEILGNDLSEATEKLAMRRVAGKILRQRREKLASLKQADILEALKSNPTLTAGLLGAGAGGVYGGLTSLGRRKEERQTGSNILTGALAGGALGAGGAMAAGGFSKLLNAPKPGTQPIEFEHGGQKHTLKPDAVSKNPGLLDEVKGQTRKSLPHAAVDTIGGGIGSYIKNHPILSAIGGMDAFTSGARALGGKQTTPMDAGPVRKLYGEIKDKDLPTQYSELAGLNTKKDITHELAASRTGKGSLLSGIGKKQFGDAVRDAGTSNNPLRSILDLKNTAHRYLYDKLNSLTKMKPDLISRKTRNMLAPGLSDPMAFTGYTQNAAGEAGKLEGMGGSLLRRWNKKPSLGAGIAGRAALYGGVPLLEWYNHQRGQSAAGRRNLDELVGEVAR